MEFSCKLYKQCRKVKQPTAGIVAIESRRDEEIGFGFRNGSLSFCFLRSKPEIETINE